MSGASRLRVNQTLNAKWKTVNLRADENKSGEMNVKNWFQEHIELWGRPTVVEGLSKMLLCFLFDTQSDPDSNLSDGRAVARMWYVRT